MTQERLVSLLIGLEDNLNRLKELSLFLELIGREFDQPDNKNCINRAYLLLEHFESSHHLALEEMTNQMDELRGYREQIHQAGKKEASDRVNGLQTLKGLQKMEGIASYKG